MEKRGAVGPLSPFPLAIPFNGSFEKEDTRTWKKFLCLLDTDIGSDIDDAVALAYLLRQPKCDLLGITTVTGEPEKRASIADAVCRLSDRTRYSDPCRRGGPFL